MHRSDFAGTTSGAWLLGLVFVMQASCGSSKSNASGTGSPGQTADGGSDAGPPGDCQSGDTTPCTSFTTPKGMNIQLGSYGAQMDVNVGKGFENPIQMGDTVTATCTMFADSFGEDPNLTAKLLQTTQNGVTLDFSLYTVYRPVHWPSGPVPVITWGNGTCAQPEGYGALLRYVASYGYFVVAANSRWVQGGSPAPMTHALDYAAAANMDAQSPYYQKLDLTKVGAMGHSQGGMATVSAANDSRVQSVIVFNASDTGVAKPYLAISGQMDITGFTAQTMANAINSASVPAAWLYYKNPVGMGFLRGHLVLMLSPERVIEPTKAWWEMTFRNDQASHDLLVGANCGLCSMNADYSYGEHGLM